MSQTPGVNVDRRKFLGGSIAAAGLTTAAVVATPQGAAAEGAPLRAAVLEFLDPWTRATGLAQLLRQAGFEVVDLDLTANPTTLGVDLVAFGTFTNNDTKYAPYVAAQTQGLRDFVNGGGVVIDFAQSDQFGAATAYLPDPMEAVRADPDHDAIYPYDAYHPLVGSLPRSSTGQVFSGRSTAFRVSYETLFAWNQMRILLSASTTFQPPVLLEGAHGAGRFLVTSLSVDKVWGSTGTPVQPANAVQDSVTFFTALASYVGSVKAGTAPVVVPTPVPKEPAAGPLVGHVSTSTARIWIRPGKDDQQHASWTCKVNGPRGPMKSFTATLRPENDFTTIFDLDTLSPRTRYAFTIAPTGVSEDQFPPLRGSFLTAPPNDKPGVVTIGMGSCAPSSPDPVWDRVIAEGCDSFVLLGDTPYIDSTDLRFARQRHREFLQQPPLARVVSSMPVWGTWDDHDFALNGQLGDAAGKANTRRAFVDYRANATFGQTTGGQIQTERGDGEGVYTSFRRGPVEVFLVDPRWFSRTGPSFADPTQQTCIGPVQWEWLKQGLLASTAPFKVIATGMIWDDKQNSESDDWETFSHEREAIFDFVRDNAVKGVLLLSGDIHVSRALNYGPRVGYDLWQFIVSPLHDRTIPSLNVPHPALVHSAVEPNVFLKLVADTTVSPATLTATWINRDGRRIFQVRTDAKQLGH